MLSAQSVDRAKSVVDSGGVKTDRLDRLDTLHRAAPRAPSNRATDLTAEGHEHRTSERRTKLRACTPLHFLSKWASYMN